jgi:uncharacterized protein YegP (UPF0339 family)
MAGVISKKPKNPRFDPYRDRAGKWRWRLFARNGLIVADSAECYDSMKGLRRGMKAAERAFLGAIDRSITESAFEPPQLASISAIEVKAKLKKP